MTIWSWLKYESSNIASSGEKVISSESGEKYAQIKHRLQAKIVQNKCVGGFWCERTITGYGLFSLEKALFWIIDSYFSPKQWFDIKNILMMDLFLTNKQLSLSNRWTVVVWIIVSFFFFTCLYSHSDGTHSLQRIHWWASDVMLNFSKSV